MREKHRMIEANFRKDRVPWKTTCCTPGSTRFSYQSQQVPFCKAVVKAFLDGASEVAVNRGQNRELVRMKKEEDAPEELIRKRRTQRWILHRLRSRRSDDRARGSTGRLFQWWGTQPKQVGFYEYGVSPFQQKLFVGFFTEGGAKFIKRTGKNALYILPPLFFFYSLASYADKKFEYYNRKEYLNSDEAKAAAGH
ncbi:ubiquinol--cytochrome-c reductase subunit 8 [Phlyctochytrium bullatum]|nr:ubiquinol--cytochrome-c reductase subunit 8 [Phlyctochytrium bullatum]